MSRDQHRANLSYQSCLARWCFPLTGNWAMAFSKESHLATWSPIEFRESLSLFTCQYLCQPPAMRSWCSLMAAIADQESWWGRHAVSFFNGSDLATSCSEQGRPNTTWFSEAPLWTSAPPAMNSVKEMEKEPEPFETGLGNLAVERWDGGALQKKQPDASVACTKSRKAYFHGGSCPLSFSCKYCAGIELPQYFLIFLNCTSAGRDGCYWASRLEAVCSRAKAPCAYLGLSYMFDLF